MTTSESPMKAGGKPSDMAPRRRSRTPRRRPLGRTTFEAIRNTVTPEPSGPVLKAVAGGCAAREREDQPA